MSERPAPLTAERLAELRSYHDPCGWSCAAKTAGRPCETAQWLATLDATNEPECARGSSGSATWCVTHDALWPSLSSKCEGWISTHRVSAPVDREEMP